MLRTLLAGFLLLLPLTVQADFRISVARPRLEFELLDGTRLSGEAVEADAAMKLTTSLGEVRVPLVQLTRIELPDYSGQAILHFSNGDRLKGRLPPGIEVQTQVGRVTVPLSKARSLRVIPRGLHR